VLALREDPNGAVGQRKPDPDACPAFLPFFVLRWRPHIIEACSAEVAGAALLLTHYAIRHLMHEAADDIGLDEDRLSFIRSLRVVRRSIVNDGDFPP
jgi:hypothetical protein